MPVGASKKGHCFSWMKSGSCRHGMDYAYLHEPDRKGRSKSPEGKGGNRNGKHPGRGKSPNPSEGKGSRSSHASVPTSRLCRFFAKGRCEKGNDCPFRHEGSGETRTDKNEQPKGQNKDKSARSRKRSPSPPRASDRNAMVSILCPATERRVHFGAIDTVEYEKRDFGISADDGKLVKELWVTREIQDEQHEARMKTLKPYTPGSRRPNTKGKTVPRMICRAFHWQKRLNLI